MPRYLRYLRIGWTVFCSIAVVLLVLLWVRSGSDFDDIGLGMSAQGKLYVSPKFTITPIDDRSAKMVSIKHFSGMVTTHSVWNGRIKPLPGTGPAIPYWSPILVTCLLAALPWIRWRFSLKTLLLATTAVAVVLGAVVWASR